MKINAVFEGGGVKGIALVGAIKAAEEAGVRFERMAGTSSGAIVASLLASGYTADEMRSIVINTPLKSLAEPRDWMRLRVVGAPIRLLLMKGLYSGDPLEQWISRLLSAKGIATFADLPARKLRIVASNISEGKLLVLPDDLPGYGIDPDRFPVARAVRMSTSLPYFYEPVMLKIGKSRVYVVDGGLLSNFPLWLFDQDFRREHGGEPLAKLTPTVGFQLVGQSAGVPHPVRGPLSMLYALFATMMEAHDQRYIEDHNRYRTIKIPTLGVHTTQFTLSDEESIGLYDSGLTSGKRFFDRWSMAAYQKNFEHYDKLLV